MRGWSTASEQPQALGRAQIQAQDVLAPGTDAVHTLAGSCLKIPAVFLRVRRLARVPPGERAL